MFNNRLTSLTDIGGTSTFAYDSNGNLVQVQRGLDNTVFGWSIDDELTSITCPDQTTAFFGYDAEGNRDYTNELANPLRFIFEGSRVCGEYDNAWNLAAKYTLPGGSFGDPLLGMRRGGASFFYLPDAGGSISGLRRNNG